MRGARRVKDAKNSQTVNVSLKGSNLYLALGPECML